MRRVRSRRPRRPTLAVAKLDPDGVSFAAVLNALLSDTRANLLSNPSVLTLDNEEATVVAGDKIPFRTGSFTTTTDGASNPFQTINRENVGVTLTVTPHIHEEGSIRMVVSVKAGNVVDAAVGAGSFADVVTSERELTSTILVQDRQIILLGGLIQDDYRDVAKRVPLLGNVPVLGRAFRSDTQTLTKRYLLMFLKPTIFRTADEAERLARERYNGIYRLQRETEVPMPEALGRRFRGRGLGASLARRDGECSAFSHGRHGTLLICSSAARLKNASGRCVRTARVSAPGTVPALFRMPPPRRRAWTR